MFQPIRAIARILLVPATLATVALTSQTAASAGALPAAHFTKSVSGAVAASTPADIHWKSKW